MATPPWIMDSDGKKKLSKRDGAKDVLAYQAQGFLPEALVNFLATLGWNDSTKQEFFSVDELKAKFRLDRVQRSGAQFDEQRLIWMNGHYIRKLPLAELYERTRDFWPAEAASYDDDYKKRVLGLVQERLKFLAELPKLINFFFSDLPPDMALIDDNKQLKQLSHAELKQLLVQVRASLEQSDFSAEDLTKRLNDLLVQTNQKPVVLFSLTRIATTQAPFSPELAPTLAVLGKEVSMRRIDQQLANL
jgi:glutamyl/glutaminyl-tRNA synthetase